LLRRLLKAMADAVETLELFRQSVLKIAFL
jgi:hypothetical protein